MQPEMSDQIEFSVQAEDVIILGTDGLYVFFSERIQYFSHRFLSDSTICIHHR